MAQGRAKHCRTSALLSEMGGAACECDQISFTGIICNAGREKTNEEVIATNRQEMQTFFAKVCVYIHPCTGQPRSTHCEVRMWVQITHLFTAGQSGKHSHSVQPLWEKGSLLTGSSTVERPGAHAGRWGVSQHPWGSGRDPSRALPPGGALVSRLPSGAGGQFEPRARTGLSPRLSPSE